MPYCTKCGVEIEETQERCPLCGSKNLAAAQKKPGDSPEKPSLFKKNYDRAEVRYIRNRFNYFYGLCAFAVMLVSLITDLSISGGVTWSRFVLSSCLLAWFCVSYPIKRYDYQPVTIITALCFAVPLYLLYIDYLTGFDGWSLYPAVSVLFVSGVLNLILRKWFKSANNKASLSMLLLAVFITVIDFLSGYKLWSLYVVLSLALAWSFFLLPTYLKGNFTVMGAMLADSIFILGFLFFCLSIIGRIDKFTVFALPLVITVCVPVMTVYAVARYTKTGIYGILSLCFMLAGLMAMSIDFILNYNIIKDVPFLHQWSYIVAACLGVISILLFIAGKSKPFQEFLDKKFNL